MSLAETIAPHLPYLRRFARALTGSQESGDAYVVAVLETLVADPESFPQGQMKRVGLYKCFLKVWNSISVNQEPATPKTQADRSLEAITPMPRQAFLLASVEGFTTQQIAEILDCTPETVTQLIEEAGTQIAEQTATDVLIIEDEPLISMDLEALVKDLGHRVSGVARTHREALAEVRKRKPGLVLADIHLADGSSGLDAVNEILLGFNVPVIFITAFPERLLTGERPEPTFLITKPFEPNTVRALVSQALFFGTSARIPEPTAGVGNPQDARLAGSSPPGARAARP
ncbi:chemotaxis protein CheY [Hyphomicrobium nitrativorans NL23]|uniref:Chemotaxis protein CheY n=1 Tax=Hyphomicrobium nitrativorans NL23 TaxID=1029756 RepID=V5SCZ5_9HYPH|nr:response regulator [Hyphomicrobium nitrativorans]AHB48347.1 chemotaxis protein CheY [Hyphomicrobium nitrativorans NL23]